MNKEHKKVARLYSDLGIMVASGRKIRKVTQQELANAVGLHRVSIANIEAGRQRPPFHTVVLIAELLDIDLNLPRVAVEKSEEILSRARGKRVNGRVDKIQRQISALQERLRQCTS